MILERKKEQVYFKVKERKKEKKLFRSCSSRSRIEPEIVSSTPLFKYDLACKICKTNIYRKNKNKYISEKTGKNKELLRSDRVIENNC